eukprot:4629690-Amphidinium_carterae.1
MDMDRAATTAHMDRLPLLYRCDSLRRENLLLVSKHSSAILLSRNPLAHMDRAAAIVLTACRGWKICC